MSECDIEGCAGIEGAQTSIEQQVKEGYWGVIGVGAEVPFFYTVGLHHLDSPELLIIGSLPPQAATMLLNTAGEQLMHDIKDRFDTSTTENNIANMPVAFVNVNEAMKRKYCTQAFNHYGHWDFDVQQMVWPDREGKFPWDADSAFAEGGEFHSQQPVLGD